ncbi:hypothetical protein BCR36DRAFT_414926 [Piromyces finnis]|uniref:Coth-domain-containing protein n=1 Tax=Piromyces finnis TaxID=1754191 RepID=A0A1Y1V245_9FUNG|nr:hypothetical protein BCR36DRAFT_414926 [Piromyces finnis]|eukprot:ORX44692.1 hypothetical protein BCR36DRAFT_414926 [Piromyces finnis]
MRIRLIGLSILVAYVRANKYNFNVVSLTPNKNSLCVKWNNNVQLLTSSIKPLFTGTVDTDKLDKYKYVICNESGEIIEEENFERTYSEESSKTNEVYNRKTKKVTIPEFPEPFKPMFKMSSKKFQPFPKDTIYNVYAECDEEGYNNLINTPFIEEYEPNQLKINCTMSIISPDNAYKSTGLMHLLGFGSRRYRKLSWSMKFDKKFLGRKSIKLRGVANDPTLMRENLSIELFKSAGVPVQSGTYARLIINGDVYGLYHMIDSLNGNWLANCIHGDNKAQIGFSYNIVSSPVEGPYAELKYLGDSYDKYSTGIYEVDEYDKNTVKSDDEPAKWKHLIEFTKLYDNWVKNYGDDTSDKAIEELKKFFNIESVLRLMAVESLILALDNFWLVMSNAALYYNPERKNYQILPFDFDEVMSGDRDSVLIDHDTYMNDCGNWAHNNDKFFDHYFTKNLMKHPQIKERYDVIIAKLSRETYTPDQVSFYVHAISDLIKDDIEWNFKAIDNLDFYEDGLANHFTLKEFEGNLDKTPVDYDSSKNSNDAPYGIVQWAELRSNGCKEYTKSTDTSNNSNISDDVDISGSQTSMAITITTLIILAIQCLHFILF